MDEFSIRIFLITAFADIDVTLLAYADLADDFLDVATLLEDSQRQIIVAHVSQGVPTVILSSVKHALMLEKVLDDFECV